MGQIREYTTQVNTNADIPVRRAQARPNSFGGGSRAGIAFGQQLQRTGDTGVRVAKLIEKEQGRAEVTNGHAAMIQAEVDLKLRRKEILNTANPDDPDLVKNYLTEVDERLQSLSGQYTTPASQALFAKKSAQLKGQATLDMAQSQSTLQGVAAKQKVEASTNNLRNIVAADPTQYEAKAQDLDDMISDPNGKFSDLDPAVRIPLIQQMKEDLALSAVEGTMLALPEAGIKQVKSGKWDKLLDADKRKQMILLGETTIKAHDVEARRVKEEARTTFERSRDSSRDGHLNDFVKSLAPGGDTFSLMQTIADPNVRGADKLGIINAVDRFTKAAKEVTLDQGKFANFVRRIEADFGDPDKLVDKGELLKELGVGLTPAAYGQLTALVDEMATPAGQSIGKRRTEFFAGIKPQIDKSNPAAGIIDKTGGQSLDEYRQFARRKEELMRNNNEDPHQIYDSSSKFYIGDKETKFRFQKTISESIAAGSEITTRKRTQDNVAPEIRLLPNETTAEWTARMKGAGKI